MCGSCGTAVPRHWSAPFLASQAARATAASAITALIGPQPAVAAVPAGFLIRRATGGTTLAPDLGAVWRALDRPDVSRPAPADYPAHITGPVTLPEVRNALIEVQLVLYDEPPGLATTGNGRTVTPEDPTAEQHVDGRDADPHDVIARLRELSASSAASAAPRTARLILGSADLPRTLPHLAADPTHPYQLRLPPAPHPRDRPGQWPHAMRRPASVGSIPALLAWAGGRREGELPERLVVHLPVKDSHTFELEMLQGVVVRATVALTRIAQ